MAKHDKGRKKGDKAVAVDAETDAHAAGRKPTQEHSSDGHHPAKAHGRPATVDASLPATREELLVRHAEARRRRAGASLGSEAYREAADEIGRIEVRIAAVERELVPPRT